jgi:hypothetical protein
MTERTLTTVALVALVVSLAAIGVLTVNTPVLTMAAGALTGLFAWIQAPGQNK